MDDDYNDSHGAWVAQQEQQRRMREDELARYLAANPGYEHCPNHPERPVVDSGVCTKRFCAECVQERQMAYAEHMVDAAREGWTRTDQYDMNYYSDHPRHTGESKGLRDK